MLLTCHARFAQAANIDFMSWDAAFAANNNTGAVQNAKTFRSTNDYLKIATDETDTHFRTAQTIQLAAADTPSNTIAVVYPDIGEPFRSVFSQILEGIENRAKSHVISIRVLNNTSPQDVSSEVRKQDARVVIALGRGGLKAAAALEANIPIVASAIINAPDSDPKPVMVYSLAPDPGLLFAKLKTLSPSIRRIFVVHEPEQNGWLMRMAKDAARAQGLELVRYDATDLKAAVKNYQDIFAMADARHDAIWIPQDSISAEDSTVLPFVLEESWNRSLTVFSSSVSHVRRGALFALYPDNVELGRKLAASALSLTSSSPPVAKGSIQALQQVSVALNTRTASHLGLSINVKEQGIDLIFPTP
ncbi:MAG TPA: ABC transporter substrate binding protein [Rhodocyclaceae bacterium]|nr:ABC transporter substrate binding protein [Rhodocyclaceae bacterium]